MLVESLRRRSTARKGAADSMIDPGRPGKYIFAYGRITGNSEAELFCNHVKKSNEDTEDLCCIKPVEDLNSIKLAAPSNYCADREHAARIDRLETLIRYVCFQSGEGQAVQPRLEFFEAHFRGACRDVARGTGAVIVADEIADDETLTGEQRRGEPQLVSRNV